MTKILASIFFWVLFTTSAFSMTPFTQAALDNAYKNDEKVLLYFHAEWCPSCQAMKKSLDELEREGQLQGFTTFLVDFDKEVELKKFWSVKYQSNLIALRGVKKTGEVNGVKDKEELKKFFVRSGLR